MIYKIMLDQQRERKLKESSHDLQDVMGPENNSLQKSSYLLHYSYIVSLSLCKTFAESNAFLPSWLRLASRGTRKLGRIRIVPLSADNYFSLSNDTNVVLRCKGLRKYIEMLLKDIRTAPRTLGEESSNVTNDSANAGHRILTKT